MPPTVRFYDEHVPPPPQFPVFAIGGTVRRYSPIEIKGTDGIFVVCMEIDPPLAECMLGLNADNQRKLVDNSIRNYAADQAAGRWRLTHQGLAFNRSGRLVDGQNRLWAVFESGSTIVSLVFFGVGDLEEQSTFDGGKSRTVVDASITLGREYTKEDVATITAFLQHARPNRNFRHPSCSRLKMVELIDKYEPHIKAVHGWFGRPIIKGVTRAPIRGAVLAARIGGVPDSVLERFVGVLTDKIPAVNDADAAPRLLRIHVGNNVASWSKGTSQDSDLFLRTCQCIQSAARGDKAKITRPLDHSPWTADENRPQTVEGGE